MMKKVIAFALALLLVLSLAACGQTAPKQEETKTAETQAADAQQTKESEATPAPDFTLVDQYGKEHRLSDYKGKVVLLNFWATWCKYCVQEMPDLQKLHEKYSAEEDPQLVLLGVAAPGQGGEQDVEGIKAFLAEKGCTYPSVMDMDASVFKTYGASGLPTTFVIGRDGSVANYIPGAVPADVLQTVVDQALGTNAATEATEEKQ